jgi:hypothetical protein
MCVHALLLPPPLRHGSNSEGASRYDLRPVIGESNSPEMSECVIRPIVSHCIN